MSGKHTIGPWEVGHVGETGDFVIYAPHDENQVQIASRLGFKSKRDEMEANDRLIERSPELLKALKIALDRLDRFDKFDLSGDYELIRRIEGMDK